jgi:hypothetical protein
LAKSGAASGDLCKARLRLGNEAGAAAPAPPGPERCGKLCAVRRALDKTCVFQHGKEFCPVFRRQGA